MFKKLTIACSVIFFAINITQSTPNRNIIWKNNSCWINSGLQCMTTFYQFRTKLNALLLKENSLEFELKTILDELTASKSSPIDTFSFYKKAVSLGIGAMGTGGGDFVPSILLYLVTNRVPELKYLFSQVHQIKREGTIKNLSAEAIAAEAEMQTLRDRFMPQIKSISFFTDDEELKKQRKALVDQFNKESDPLKAIIKNGTVERQMFEYRIAYNWTIKSIKEITEEDSSLIVFPKYLLLSLSFFVDDQIPLTIRPYGCNKEYRLQAKGLTSTTHATSVVRSQDNKWYFYDDLGEKITLVNEEVVKNKKYKNYNTDFLYYEAENIEEIFIQDNKNMTPLHWAALSQNVEMLKQHIQNGDSIDAKTATNETPLHFAALVGSTKSIKLLLQKGADISNKNNAGMTPLSFAIAQLNFEAIRLLMKYGADINQTYHASGKFSLSHLISITSTQNKEVSCKIIKFIIAHGMLNSVLNDAYIACSKNNSSEIAERIKLLLNPNPIEVKLTLLIEQLFDLKKKLSNLKKSITQLKIKLGSC